MTDEKATTEEAAGAETPVAESPKPKAKRTSSKSSSKKAEGRTEPEPYDRWVEAGEGFTRSGMTYRGFVCVTKSQLEAAVEAGTAREASYAEVCAWQAKTGQAPVGAPVS